MVFAYTIDSVGLGHTRPYSGQDKICRFCSIDTTGIQVAARVAQQAQEVALMMVSMMNLFLK